MNVQILPFVPSIGNYQFETYIEDVNYVFDVRWNERDAAWYFDISDADGKVISSGLKLVIGANVGRYSNNPLFTQGVFAVVDTSGEQRDPGFDDIGIGRRVEVRYYNLGAMAGAIFAI